MLTDLAVILLDQTATLISSTAPDVTRSECGNVLRSMGVTVALEEGGGWGTLRCHVDRIQGTYLFFSIPSTPGSPLTFVSLSSVRRPLRPSRLETRPLPCRVHPPIRLWPSLSSPQRRLLYGRTQLAPTDDGHSLHADAGKGCLERVQGCLCKVEAGVEVSPCLFYSPFVWCD
jgi:hypothetical protein